MCIYKHSSFIIINIKYNNNFSFGSLFNRCKFKLGPEDKLALAYVYYTIKYNNFFARVTILILCSKISTISVCM